MFYKPKNDDFRNESERKQVTMLDCILQELIKLEGLPQKLFAKLVFPDLVRIISLKNNDNDKYFDVNYELSREVTEYLQDVCTFIETKNQTKKFNDDNDLT